MFFTPHSRDRLMSRFNLTPRRLSPLFRELSERIQRKHYMIVDKHADAYHVVTWFGDGRGILLVLTKNLSTVITCYNYDMAIGERIMIKENPALEFRKS